MKRAIKLACRCCQNIVIRHVNDHLVPLWNPLQVSYYVAEFWNTVSNVFIFAPPIFGIADALYQGRIIFDSELLLPGDDNKRDPERENWPCSVMLLSCPFNPYPAHF